MPSFSNEVKNELSRLEVQDVSCDKAELLALLRMSGAKDPDEFIKAIASDTLIIIDSEQIDLSTAKNYGEGAIEFWNCPEDSFFHFLILLSAGSRIHSVRSPCRLPTKRCTARTARRP